MSSSIEVSLAPPTEREGLLNVLDAQRVGLIRKVEDVADDVARKSPTASSLTLLGLVKHAATWEQRWFHVIVAGRELLDGWPAVRPQRVDADLFVDEDDTVARWIAIYRSHSAISTKSSPPFSAVGEPRSRRSLQRQPAARRR
jgi:hypothetical protein